MTVAQHNWKRLAGQMGAGALTGAAVTAGLLFVLDERGLDLSDGSRMLALVAGIIYGLVGLVVGLGTLYPDVGSKLLNVEDAEELRDERPKLGPSAIGFVLVGVFFVSLAAASSGEGTELLSAKAAAVLALLSLAGLVATTLLASRRTDELTQQVSSEASSATLHLGLLLLGAWAALAHVGLVEWIEPLSLIAGAALLYLLVAVWACTKRGLLVPRG